MKQANCFKLGLGMLIGGITIASVIVLAGAKSASAESEVDIVFPVAELAGCTDKEACKTYCEKPDNIEACLTFAEKYNLLSPEEIEKGKKFAQIKVGPGGCTNQSTCEVYCGDVNNIEECVAFAEQNGLMPPEELEEAKKIQAALQKGAKMPGGCKNKESCEAYCESGDNIEECIAFAEAAGFIDPKEAEMVRKTGGKGPGGCKGKNECESYCEKEENFETCLDFAAEHNLISPEELEMARKTGGKGPGGCRGESCKTYCDDSTHQEECFKFAKENGFLKEEDLRRMEEGRSKMKEALTQAPPEVASCLKSAVGEDILTKLDSGEFFGGPEIGEKMRSCFEQFMKPPQNGEGSPFGGPFGKPFRDEFEGPGGCKTPDECAKYCQENPDACKGFGPSQGVNGEMMVPHQGEFNEFPEMIKNEVPYRGEEEFKKEFERQYQEQYQKQYLEGQSTSPYPTNLPCNSEAECLKLRQEMEAGYREQMQNQMPMQQLQQDMMPPKEYKYPEGNYPQPPEGSQYQNEPYSSTPPPPDGNYQIQPPQEQTQQGEPLPPAEPMQESTPPPPPPSPSPESLLLPLYPTAFILQVFFGLLGI